MAYNPALADNLGNAVETALQATSRSKLAEGTTVTIANSIFGSLTLVADASGQLHPA